ncbi:FecR family protein [Marinifilum sp. D714]|uniref:FecR family protein n=1 Tax=Marinifilum sp. D714 TaxID=2937523 RepID=UPI0027C4F08B|nr:FecR family protein [Marinifilum sp. D714]MDQ2180453.1 FecR family protein [Marinifilum sp. D714]
MDNQYRLIKYHQKKLNESENREVEKWLAESESNEKEYEQYVSLWLAAKQSKVLHNLNMDHDWNLILRIANGKPKLLNKAITYALRIAAILVIAFGVYWFSDYTIFKPEYQYVKNEWKNKVKTITLDDGSTVSLNYMASLHYPKHFSRKERKIKLQGNAFFNVARNEAKPFRVETPISMVQVLGTSFDVDASVNKSMVTVTSGKVKVSNKADQNSFVELLPNEQAIQNGNSLQKNTVSAQNFIGWKTGKYLFKNESLLQVMTLLERRFHFSFHFADRELKLRELTAEFNGENLNDIIEIIQLSCQVRINLESNNLTISKNE